MSNMFGDLNADALQRAAHAVRELSQSKHSTTVLSALSKHEEAMKSKHQVEAKLQDIEQIKFAEEEQRQTNQDNVQNLKSSYDYHDKLERKRYTDKLIENERTQDQILQSNEESVRKQEEMKRKTIDYEMKKYEEIEIQKQQLKAEMRSKIQRDTQDLKEQNIILQEKEHRETMKELFSLSFDRIGKGFGYLMDNPYLIKTFFLYTAGVSAAFYLSKTSIVLAGKLVENHFSKPSLVRETSRIGLQSFYKLPVVWANKILEYNSLQKTKNIFDSVVLQPELENNLQSITYALVNQRKNRAPLRNFLFYGPPGTGQTLFAKQLALHSGLDFAILTGADIAPLGTNGVSELHQVFDWANTSKQGIIIFIDEADAFFRKREGTVDSRGVSQSGDASQISENLRNAINAFLYRTGTPSMKVMFILATNTPQQLDKALNDRVDKMIFFDLPQIEQRVLLIQLYLKKYFNPEQSLMKNIMKNLIDIRNIFEKPQLVKLQTDVDEEFIKKIAKQTEGFSAREIEKFIISCHDQAFSLPDPIVNKDIMLKIMNQYLQQHESQREWENQ